MPQDFNKAITLTTFSSASLTTSYQAVNSSGLTKPCFLVRIVNDNTTAITISYDGINDNDYIEPHGKLELGSQTQSEPNNKVNLSPLGRVIYVKGTAGTGTIAVSGYYL